MDYSIFLTLLLFLLPLICIAIGYLLNRDLLSKIKNSFIRILLLSLSRALFYSPGLLFGGHGMLPYTAIVAIPVQYFYFESKYIMGTLFIPSVVFGIGFFVSFIKLTMADKSFESLPILEMNSLNEIDYSNYSIEELIEAKKNINSESNPKNYLFLLSEIDKRAID